MTRHNRDASVVSLITHSALTAALQTTGIRQSLIAADIGMHPSTFGKKLARLLPLYNDEALVIATAIIIRSRAAIRTIESTGLTLSLPKTRAPFEA